jgi:DNA-binding NarL/FixJ family response regulator
VPRPLDLLRALARGLATLSFLLLATYPTYRGGELARVDALAAHTVAPSAYPGGMTAREVAILRLVAKGLTNALAISVKTVETHRAAITRKLRLASLAALVRYAVRNQLIEP